MWTFFGPFVIRGEVNKRARGKAYALLFNCGISRATYIDLATDYSALGFLMVLRRFCTLKGYPNKMFTDPGSQLVAADGNLKEVSEVLTDEQIGGFCSNNGIDWEFSSADAPWQNGCSEGLV